MPNDQTRPDVLREFNGIQECAKAILAHVGKDSFDFFKCQEDESQVIESVNSNPGFMELRPVHRALPENLTDPKIRPQEAQRAVKYMASATMAQV